ncbi:MAG: sigma 54-interacting transcriptional regulator [Desulfofustis sp.]|jgi:transcriptional regulator with PAS, ATPase and Fis domain|nr:sigma 54-interacting transcriptional regulator [Desulfofustis sp.]
MFRQPAILTLLEGIPYPSMILDSSFRIVTMNRLMMATTGYESDRVRGVHGELVVRSNVGNSKGQLYSQVMKTGEAVSVSGDILNGYRHKVPVQYHISPLANGKNGTAGLLVIAENVASGKGDNGGDNAAIAPPELIGHSPKMQKVLDLIPLMAHTDASVLITGETGTGKDKIAEIIHKKSARARFPFIKVNCGALPLGLLESELFGHVKGAFTGASRNKPGMFKIADRGTLFLTEIGDMPMPLQVKLLSVLDDRQFVPVGGEHSVSVDVRIIAATHRPLREQVRNNTFREDLYYRLNVLHVHLPPLRERENDTRMLLDHFLEKYTRALGKTVTGFTPSALQTLLSYHFPGNVRELQNIVEYAVNICKGKKINKEQLPPYIFEKQPEAVAPAQPPVTVASEPDEKQQPSNPPAVDNGNGSSWSSIERQMIVDALKKNGGNRINTAADLGWGRMKLWRKMKKYGLLG